MPVPHLLSQTWISADLPPRARVLRDRWASLNPDLTLRLYDDAGARAVMAAVRPDALPLYDALPFGVMRADLFRLAVLVRDGGIYADIDMQPLRPLPAELFDRACVLSIEAHLTRRRQHELGYAQPVQIANCILVAEAGHPFLAAALDRALDLVSACPGAGRERIEDLTGPRMLTRLLLERDWPDLWIAPQIQLMAPLDYPDLWPLNRHMIARHETHGSWKATPARVPLATRLARRWIERNRLVNPLAAPVWRSAADLRAGA